MHEKFVVEGVNGKRTSNVVETARHKKKSDNGDDP